MEHSLRRTSPDLDEATESLYRLRDAVEERVLPLATDEDLRAQLHALVGVLGNLAKTFQAAPGPDAEDGPAEELSKALALGEENTVIAAAQAVARADRARIEPIDWDAASRGT